MPLLKFFGSLGFALFLIAGLVVILTVSTVLESVHGTPFAQENFYQAHWFDLFLALVWVNIFCATLTRWPFQKKHVGFVITHLGILTLLLGSLGTRVYGREGQMTLFEEEAKSRMLESGFSLRVSLPDGGEKKIDLKPLPLNRTVKLPLPELPFQMELTRVIPHALEARTLEEDPALGAANHALQATLASEMLGFKQDFVLIEKDPADPEAASESIGPATFVLKAETAEGRGPTLRLFQQSTGKSFELDLRQDRQKAEWKETGLTVSNIKYFPNARVDKNRLFDQAGATHPNPAVEFEVSDGSGRREQHTRFSFFPEFHSLRGGETNNFFDLQVVLDGPDEAGNAQGPSFQFLVSGKNEWRYRVRSMKSGLSEDRPLPIGEPVPTGWMDMTVRVQQTFDHAKIANDVREDPEARSGTPAVELRVRRDGQVETPQRLILGRSLLFGGDGARVRVASEARTAALPFSLGLRDFRKIDYPGTSNAASFESDVVLQDASKGVAIERTIRMNKPLDYLGWRVFQSSFIQDERLGEASVFTIAKNPGLPAVYGGAALIFAGVILLFYFHPFFTGEKSKEKREKIGVAARPLSRTRSVSIIFIFLFSLFSSFAEAAYTREQPVQHNGRVKPFDAFARQTLRLVAGSENWAKKDPTDFFTEILSEPGKIAELEWIRVEHAELKKTLKLAQNDRFFSLNDTLPSLGEIGELVQSSKDKRDRDLRPSKLEQKAEELYTKVRTVQALIRGENFRKLGPFGGVSKTRLELEVWYYRFKPFEWAALMYLLAFLVLSASARSAWMDKAGLWAAAGAFLFHTLGLASRVYILARPPVSNMYESMIFMNWALMAFAFLFCALRRSPVAAAAGALMSALVMLYANLLPIDSSLDVVVAVLRSNYWLSVHVLTVVSSYGAFGLALALGHRHLFLEATGKLSKKAGHDSAGLIFRVIQLGTILIGTGTFLGGVWANESWGRFWGWDPKETWALITFLGYLLVVHLKYAKKISDLYLALSSVLGFLLVLMTWYGVNFVLGRGLHSYGAGSGGMRWVIYFLIFEAAFVGWVFWRKVRTR